MLKRGTLLISSNPSDDRDLYVIVRKGVDKNHYVIKHVKTGLMDRSTDYYVGYGSALRPATNQEIAENS